MRIYYDPSVIIALYAPEALTPSARQIVSESARSILVNELQELEFRNGLRQKVLRKDLSQGDLARCLRVFEDDCVHQRAQRKPVSWSQVFKRAELISRRLSTRHVCRSFDLLHVAIAAISEVNRFVTSDGHQARIAIATGLDTIDLSSP